jgi:hypothetical protein
MAVTPKLFYRAAGATGNATLVTVPAGKTWIITNIVVSNIGSSSSTYTMDLDDDSGNLVLFLPQVSIPAYGVEVIDVKQVLSAGRRIYGSTGSTDVKWHISGVEIS